MGVTFQRLTPKAGRNDPCPCGSGKKYKRCCIDKAAQLPSQAEMERMVESLHRKREQLPEPHLHLVPSIVFKGYRHRPIWNTLHHRPLEETFHEFIIRILLRSFGEDWRQQQWVLPDGQRHVLLRWVESYGTWKKANRQEQNREGENRWGAVPSGEVLALHQFAYDIYCLQVVNKLPDHLVNRLKNVAEYQGARYEVAVAALIARAGYEITFLDDRHRSQKHCEFIAKNKYSGEEIAVEAKSRRRKGVIHEPGTADQAALVKGDVERLFREACTQRSGDMPYLIFIDLNVLPTPGVPMDKKPWLEDIKGIIAKLKDVSPESHKPFNAWALTNFSYYYAGNAGDAPSGEYVLVVSPYPEVPTKDPESLGEVWESLQRYSHIPMEV